MEDFGFLGDEALMEPQEYYWIDRPDDFNVWEEGQIALDNEGGYDDEVVEADDVQGFEDDAFEEALFGADC